MGLVLVHVRFGMDCRCREADECRSNDMTATGFASFRYKLIPVVRSTRLCGRVLLRLHHYKLIPVVRLTMRELDEFRINGEITGGASVWQCDASARNARERYGSNTAR